MKPGSVLLPMDSKTQQKYNIRIDLVKNDVQTATSTNIPTPLQQKKVRYKN
jgi:hypothetical protein